MRMKFKPWAREELETSPFYIDNPLDYKNKWKTIFKNNNKIHLELGCGKGNFIAKLSKKNQDINYIAIDLVDAMLGMAKRNVEAVYGIRESTVQEVIEDEIHKLCKDYGQYASVEVCTFCLLHIFITGLFLSRSGCL